MPSTPVDSFSYINQQFRSYCKRHLENPVAPFSLYMGFLSYAKEHERYGWMKLAKEHRARLLKTAISVQARVYGYDTMKKVLDRDGTSRA